MEGWSSDSVWGLCDFVFYVRKELEEDGETQNVYAYCDLPNIDTKRRHPAFPTRILFSYDNIVKGLDGITDATVVDNIRAIEEEDFAAVRDAVIEQVKALSATAANAEMTRYITEMFPETRLSETSELHKDKLIAARDYLMSLAEKVNG
jgi:hypothetical protein